ncbi:MAG: DNA-binding protein [Deltaproteobacteria bacterium HGW-Deltaproteobacteria-3]|nr:MAG: DNA-binding protein [Deltaproteobacteria bacterium HGW-Deltaproteobacteria-3]
MTFRIGLALAASLLLWNLPQANAFSPNGGGTGMGGSGSPTAQKVSGKVVETMNSGGYTYALVDKGGVKTWVALPQSAISVGSEITCQPGMEMDNFKSTSLNRSFDSIVFSAGLASAEATVTTKPATVAAPVAAITVSKAGGANAQTIGEMLQAKVVKVNRGILGKNWLHLQDGTGNQAAGTNDLVVTTDSLPEVGEVVTITGNLSRDRDFGAGYRYGVIIENAEVTGSK